MKQVEVQIMGQSYLLGCPEGGEGRLLEAVERVDSAMCKIRDAGKVRARDRIAVLASLNLAFDLSDRPDSAQAASAPPQVMPSPPAAPASPGAAVAPALTASEADTLRALVRRLDEALGQDGQLL